ncbi:carbohydrate-binding protein [Aeoliella sp. ICT_H6.2]|uniref:Probable pectate lyase C n=1 Tax=Aeoliella straminimaris TaxID=2954799 RepID=A0A9X2JIU3_9BACT|nr:carbohydrate-binding protein [Aeoliella straminimaris]MCO6047455.1 carbohydrate-binding protein [Aeoliella straminimaris]
MSHPTRLRFESLEARHLLTTFYVDDDGGDDLQSVGSIGQPFATISRAIAFAQPGDTVSIRAGVYREQVELLRSGTEDAPIVFEAHQGEEVLITTTEPLTGWTQHSGNIYKATFDSSVRGRNGMTLFVDGVLMNEAHWSDQGSNVDELNKDEWAKTDGDSLTTIRDNSLVGLPDDYWDGAFVHAQTANWSLESKRIIDFDGATGTITVASSFSYNPDSGTRFLIYDHLNALDAPGEWYFDDDANTLYFWALGGGDPDGYDVEVKIRDEAFDLNGHHYIEIKGIDFRGGDLDMDGSSNILLQGAHIMAPDRGFGPEGSGGARALIVTGNNNIIRDNEFEHVWTPTADVRGANNQIVNNYFHHIGYNNSNYAAARLDVASSGTLFSHNTITLVGRSAIGGAGGLRSVIEYNDISEVGRISDDVGALYFGNNSLGNMVVHHNVIHDNSNPEAWGIYFDNLSSDVAVHHNITYNVTRGGLANLSNSYILWFNNTHYGDSLGVTAFRNPNSPDIAAGSRFYNNILANIDSELTGAGDPAIATHNYFNVSASNFVNAGSRDFRLKSTSGAIDFGREIAGITDGFAGMAPDAGALELGETMWDYGHDFANPPYPVYEWQRVPCSNQIVNPGFEAGMAGWTIAAGAPNAIVGNAWNYRDDGLALFGNYALELAPGDRIEQTIAGLGPNTMYEVSAQARFAHDLQLEDYDASSGSFTTGTKRNESYLGDIDAGEWVRFDNVDFSSGSSLYDRIEIGTTQNSSLNVELRLDNPLRGTHLGTLNVPSRGEPWYMTREDIAAVTGVHDLYVIFVDGGGSNGKFDRIRLLDTNTSDRITLGALGYDHLGSGSSIEVGGAYWKSASDSFTFVTGSNATSATLLIENNSSTFKGYVDFVALTGAAYQAPQSTVLELVVDPTTGRTALRNGTSAPITFHAYTIFDSAPSLLPDDWFSLEDQGYDGQIWFETPSTTSQVTELSREGETTLAPGQLVYLGALADPTLVQNLTLQYYNFETSTQTTGAVLLVDPGVPLLPGDYNGDGTVDLADYTTWRNRLGASTESFQTADGNGDGAVDNADYRLWKRQFGASLPQPNISFTSETSIGQPVALQVDSDAQVKKAAAPPAPMVASTGLLGKLVVTGRTSAHHNNVRRAFHLQAADAALASDAAGSVLRYPLLHPCRKVTESSETTTALASIELPNRDVDQCEQLRDLAFGDWCLQGF